MGGRATEAAQRAALSLHPRTLAQKGRDASMTKKVLAVAAVLAFNVGLFLVPIDYSGLGGFAYVGAFLITLLANAAVVVPVPYIPIVAHMVTSADSPALIVLSAAAGSALGESVAFFVGRVEKDIFAGHAWYERLRGFFAQELRAALFLFFFAVPLNPVFDVGGLAAGAFGLRYRTFLLAIFAGRVVRFAILALLAFGLISFLSLRP